VNDSVIWPGATTTEMQTQVADPIEKKLQELPYFDKVQTYSKPSFTAMQVTFRDFTPPKDVPYLFYLLRKKLVDVQDQLPAGILGPVVNDEFSDVASILFMITGDGADYAQLKKVAEAFRQRLLKINGVRSTFTGPRTSASMSNSATPNSQRLASRRRHCSIRSPNRTMSCRPARSKPRRNACRCASRVRSTGQSGCGDAGRKQRAGVPPG
jgi:hypothetical protein